jgi:hypothetical protein
MLATGSADKTVELWRIMRTPIAAAVAADPTLSVLNDLEHLERDRQLAAAAADGDDGVDPPGKVPSAALLDLLKAAHTKLRPVVVDASALRSAAAALRDAESSGAWEELQHKQHALLEQLQSDAQAQRSAFGAAVEESVAELSALAVQLDMAQQVTSQKLKGKAKALAMSLQAAGKRDSGLAVRSYEGWRRRHSRVSARERTDERAAAMRSALQALHEGGTSRPMDERIAAHHAAVQACAAAIADERQLMRPAAEVAKTARADFVAVVEPHAVYSARRLAGTVAQTQRALPLLSAHQACVTESGSCVPVIRRAKRDMHSRQCAAARAL